jgi:hypothetical protein
MPSLVIPESGLSIGSSRNAPSKAGPVQDVFGLTLNDGVIEEMIRCVQNGKPIHLSFGEHPVSFLFLCKLLLESLGNYRGARYSCYCCSSTMGIKHNRDNIC